MLGDDRAGTFEFVQKLAADMHHAGLFVSSVLTKQPIEASKLIGMHGAGIAGKMIDWVLSVAIRAELIPRARRRVSAPRAFIADIAPEPCRLGLPWFEFALQPYGRAIDKKRGASSDQLADVIRNGSSSAVLRPTQSVSIERGRLTFSRAKILDCRSSDK